MCEQESNGERPSERSSAEGERDSRTFVEFGVRRTRKILIFSRIPALWTLLLRILLLSLLSCPAQHCEGPEHFSDNPQGFFFRTMF